ncbi:MAG TPA: peptidoglycan DD-metalloendopeptidase family protein [Chitinophagaceae bacterium]|nr:peptidoglycan DD-metalloendopeptidase family protein [Chitinophagaceae bacterium]
MNELISILRANQSLFAKVVPFDPEKNKLMLLDFTVNNADLTDRVLNDVKSFSDYINRKLEGGKALYGIGGYDEHREVYSKSRVFDGKSPGEEPRRLHLGMDIWGKPNTVVMAPLDGIVHSFAFNDRPGDYGATIILTHQLRGTSFYTLYGHLSLNSIKNLCEGERMMRGDKFAESGIPAENGHWPPHLHFQIIRDLQGRSGDYPGVCKYSEKEEYLNNCPDPDLILQMMEYATNQIASPNPSKGGASES